MKTAANTPQAQRLTDIDSLLARLNELEEQLQQATGDMDQTHRLATLGTIAAIIAHEYNNILTPIISYAQLALKNVQDTEFVTKTLTRTLDGAQRAARISTSLLGFAGEQEEQLTANLPNTIEESIICMGRRPEQDGIKMTVDVPDVTLLITAIDLQQVFLNLFLNARKAMKGRGGQLRVEGHVRDGVCALHVADTGPGIPATIRERLFEPFTTCPHEGSDNSPGTGLGLSICRSRIEQAGGSITVGSKPGQGTTFHLIIPMADDTSSD